MLTKQKFAERFTKELPGEKQQTDIHFTDFSITGLEEMHRYSTDERLYEFLEFAPFKTIDETKAYIEKLLDRMSGEPLDRKAMYWFVRRKSDDYLIGTACLVSLNFSRQSIEWGYGVDPELWGLSYVLQIQEALKQFVFEVLELNRLYGKTMIENHRTIQSVLASGMVHEGTSRDYHCKDNIFHDCWHYGMIAKDYQENSIESTSVSVKINDILTVVSSILTEEEITAESDMENTFSWDSINHMAIITSLKSQLSIDFSPAEIANSTSIKKIYKKAHEG
jgi:RimJ/RimL family protein N-acetyltransferase/acyl carrier protein